jgi:2-amino-4-hydroxy-6-hydroxymethyldihydropteridine diphosphokinase
LVRCYLGLGSNVDDRVGMIAKAVSCLTSQGDIVLSKMSCLYLTEPWGYKEQDDFVNAVAQVETHLGPQELLTRVKAVEKTLGRREGPRWGPRVIDIDILLYGDAVVESDRLSIPHPRICERGFVLAPLVEIAPDLIHPGTGRKVSGYLEDITGGGEASWRNLGI